MCLKWSVIIVKVKITLLFNRVNDDDYFLLNPLHNIFNRILMRIEKEKEI